MAVVSYWLLSPSFAMALAGKLRGWDRTVPTPPRDWRTASVDVVVPARNEERTIALALESLVGQDFPLRRITVIDDASTDRTAEVVRRFAELSGRDIELVKRAHTVGKTPGVREVCERSDADVLFILDADTVLKNRDYISRAVQELFRNAGVGSVCGEVMPLSGKTANAWSASSATLTKLVEEFGPGVTGAQGRIPRVLAFLTAMYRTAVYLFLHRIIYDGHLKLMGNTLNPAGCAVAYHRERLAECFAYAKPRVGDNLSVSEDIYIGHFLNWKGYRNVHLGGIQCESSEPPVTRLCQQLFLWSSSFVQCVHYFPSLPLSIFKWPRILRHWASQRRSEVVERRRLREQYRSAWGETYTRRYGRAVGLLDFSGALEKISFPAILVFLAIYNPRMALFTVLIEAMLSTAAVAVVADSGARIRSAGMMLFSTPIRLLSLLVDVAVIGRFLLDLAVGNRNWRK